MTKPVVLTRLMLDKLLCTDPECKEDHTEMRLSGQCHPYSPVYASYRSTNGILLFFCGICGTFVAGVAVADTSEESLSETLLLRAANGVGEA